MTEQKTPGKFQHIDGGLTKQLQENVVDDSRPMMERVMSAVTLVVSRGLLDQVNNDGLALPGTARRPDPLSSELPPSHALLPKD
jgi:hypothetical protein